MINAVIGRGLEIETEIKRIDGGAGVGQGAEIEMTETEAGEIEVVGIEVSAIDHGAGRGTATGIVTGTVTETAGDNLNVVLTFGGCRL